jgi:hypothetical protein
MQVYISGCLGTWYKSITDTHKGCWWNCLSYFVLKYVEQCCVSIYYSNFFLFPSCHSCWCWKPRFEHISLLFPLIWHITFIFLSYPKVFRQIWLYGKIGSTIDIWGGHAYVDTCFKLKQSKVSISLFFFFSWVYRVVESYVKLVIVWFLPATGDEGSGGICATAYKVRVSSMYRIGSYQCS